MRSWKRKAHKEEVNWVPLSVVMTDWTPNRAIQPVKRACALSAAVMVVRGIASGHLDLDLRAVVAGRGRPPPHSPLLVCV